MSTNATHEGHYSQQTSHRGGPECADDPHHSRLRCAAGQGVFGAWIDPELVAKWLGPKSTEMRIDEWDARTGGNYRYAAVQDGA